jgi:hypothetical protein
MKAEKTDPRVRLAVAARALEPREFVWLVEGALRAHRQESRELELDIIRDEQFGRAEEAKRKRERRVRESWQEDFLVALLEVVRDSAITMTTEELFRAPAGVSKR